MTMFDLVGCWPCRSSITTVQAGASATPQTRSAVLHTVVATELPLRTDAARWRRWERLARFDRFTIDEKTGKRVRKYHPTLRYVRSKNRVVFPWRDATRTMYANAYVRRETPHYDS